ncbi:MAG: NAD-dependent epimerase/dehydratase family protein [Candidatus Omnitrophota bacterium]
MKILVTGANGYIASNLVRYLVVKKYKVIALEKQNSDFNKLRDLRGKIDFVTIKNDFGSINNVFRQSRPYAVAHLAALTMMEHRPEQVKALLSSNIVFPTLLLEAMRENGVKYLVNTGTFWEYAKTSATQHPLNLYAASKSAFEHIVRYYEDAHGFRCATLKLYGVYGPFDPRAKIISLLKKSISAKDPISFSAGRQRLDLVYIDDVVRAFERAIGYVCRKRSSIHETFFIGTGQSITLCQVARIFSSCIDKPLHIRWGGRPYRTREIMNSRADIRLARLKLHWRPQFDLQSGISKMLKAEGLI